MAIVSIKQLQEWFSRKKYPKQEHFWSWLASYWHKSERIPIDTVEDLATQLNDKYTRPEAEVLSGRIDKFQEDISGYDETFSDLYFKHDDQEERIGSLEEAVGAANGIAQLDGNGKVPMEQINDALVGNVNYQGIWDAQANTPALDSTPEAKGHYYITSVAGARFGLTFNVGDWIISNGSAWDKVVNTDAVASVNGKTGAVTIAKSDVGLGNVDNTSDANKPVSTAAQTALNGKQGKLVAGSNITIVGNVISASTGGGVGELPYVYNVGSEGDTYTVPGPVVIDQMRGSADNLMIIVPASIPNGTIFYVFQAAQNTDNLVIFEAQGRVVRGIVVPEDYNYAEGDYCIKMTCMVFEGCLFVEQSAIAL